MTRIWRFDHEPSSVQTNEIARTLALAGVVILPTDTIYGLHARAADEAAVSRIAAIKGRDDTKPFIVLASSPEEIRTLGVEIGERTLTALGSIWPAPLTVILPLSQPNAASRGASTLAIRIPDLDWLRELLGTTGPLVSTSVNRAGEPPLTSPSELARELQESVDGIADCGAIFANPSTILDLSTAEPRFIRRGEESFTQNVWKTLRKSL